MALYTCRIEGAYGPTDVQIDSAAPEERRQGNTYSCWLPGKNETDANARPITFYADGRDPEPPPVVKAKTREDLWLNEYSDGGTQRVELGGTPGLSIAGWKVEGYRLFSGALTVVSSGVFTLPAGTTIGADGLFVSGQSTSSTARAIAVVDPAGVVVEFLDFGTTAATNPTTGAASGMTPTVPPLTGDGASVARVGTGTKRSDFQTWKRQAGTLGQANTGQTFAFAQPEPQPEPTPTPEPTPDPQPTPEPVLEPGVEPEEMTARQVVTEMTAAYTRGAGFDAQGRPNAAVAAVVQSAAARYESNPEHLQFEQIGAYSVRPGAFLGWTLPELAVLNRYRRRAL